MRLSHLIIFKSDFLDVIGRRFTNVDSSKLEKHQEKLVYFYTSALSIQASAALTIQATADAKASVDSASLTRDTFTQDIQTIMGSEYGDSVDRSIQGIFDKRSVVLYTSTLSKMKKIYGLSR